MSNPKLLRPTLAALFAALSCVATMVIHIPLPATNGYLNLGDGVILLGAFLLGPVYGAAAGGIGAALADLFLGYPIYSPGTLIIKACTALVAALIARRFSRNRSLGCLLGGIVGEIVMAGGYLLYESLCLSYGWGAIAAVPGNFMQGAAGVAVSLLLFRALWAVPVVREWINQ